MWLSELQLVCQFFDPASRPAADAAKVMTQSATGPGNASTGGDERIPRQFARIHWHIPQSLENRLTIPPPVAGCSELFMGTLSSCLMGKMIYYITIAYAPPEK